MHSECEGHYTAAEFKALCEEYGNMGLRCGDKDASLTPDDVIPLSLSVLVPQMQLSENIRTINYRRGGIPSG